MLYNYLETDLGPVVFSRDEIGINRTQFITCKKANPIDDTWEISKTDPLLIEAEKQLKAYFAGELRTFSIPLSLAGTEFQNKVWNILITIPYGTTCTYKELAGSIGNTSACRAVGNANNKNIISIFIP